MNQGEVDVFPGVVYEKKRDKMIVKRVYKVKEIFKLYFDLGLDMKSLSIDTLKRER